MDVTEGVFPVIVTPFNSDGSVDFDSLEVHVERIDESSSHGIIPCGTTGEIATLTEAEQRDVIQTVVENSSNPVVAGTGSNATAKTVERTKSAEAAGADAALVVSPYYNQPNREGLMVHYETVANAVDIPIILYNVPHRTGQNIDTGVVAELATHPNIVGIKDSKGDMNQLSELCIRTEDEAFDVMSGYDSLLLPLLGVGGTGLVSIAGNIYPDRMSELYEATCEGDADRALVIHRAVVKLQDALFCDTNPVPIKKAMEIKGYAEERVRLPLAPMSEDDTETVRDALQAFERSTTRP